MKHIISLLAVAFLVFIFTFYIDGEMGIILIAFLLFAPLLSLIFMIYSRKRIKVSFDCDGYVKKGSELTVNVKVSKEGKLPTAFIEVETAASEVFSKRRVMHRLSLFTENTLEYELKIPAQTGGNGEVEINAVYLCGFLGFLRIKAATELPPVKSVGVIPEIPDVSASSALFRNIADAVLTSDDDEENDTVMLFSANTAPGYEHREYVPGDSMKRVNWKLSSKTSKLMVRLDEAASAVQPCIILDLYRPSDIQMKTAILREEKLLRSVFGLLNLLLKQGIACTFVYRRDNGEIISENVNNPDYPSQLLLKVLAVGVEAEKRINSHSQLEETCACIIATTDASGSFDEILQAVPDKESTCAVIPDEKSSHPQTIPVWYLAEDNNFKMV